MFIHVSLICIFVRKISVALAAPELELSSVLGHVRVQTRWTAEHFKTLRTLYRLVLVVGFYISSSLCTQLFLYLQDQKEISLYLIST